MQKEIHIETMFNQYCQNLLPDLMVSEAEVDCESDFVFNTIIKLDEEILAQGAGENQQQSKIDAIRNFFKLFDLQPKEIENNLITTHRFKDNFKSFLHHTP